MTKEEFLELMGKGSEDENKELIAAIEKVMDEKEKEPEEDPEEGWHSDESEDRLKFIDDFIDSLSDEDVNKLSDMLEHHGIDGQKWGVRNGPPYPLERGKGKQISVKDKARVILRDVDDLTLDELRYLVSKLELEEKLTRMSVSEKKQGKSYVTKGLEKFGDTLVSVAVPAATTYAFKKIIENVGGEEMVGEMFPKKK